MKEWAEPAAAEESSQESQTKASRGQRRTKNE